MHRSRLVEATAFVFVAVIALLIAADPATNGPVPVAPLAKPALVQLDLPSSFWGFP